MEYELVELSTGNMLGTYEDEVSALRDILKTDEMYGDDAVKSLALGRWSDGHLEVVAEGASLLQHARAIPA
jgi:hypothetical protein